MPNNLVHGSDSPESARREIGIWFPDGLGVATPSAERATLTGPRRTATTPTRTPRPTGRSEISWGIWAVDESELNVLGDVAGLDVVELGCGTAYFSAWLARAGARPVGVDITPAQLATARRMMAKTGIEFPLVEADAGATGLPGCELRPRALGIRRVDLGRSVPVDPRGGAVAPPRRPGRLPLQLAARRPLLGGRRRSDGNAAAPALRDAPLRVGRRGRRRVPPAARRWIELLRANGFEVERLIEVQAPPDAETHEFYAYVTAEWARQWPAEDIWVARKTRERRTGTAARPRVDVAAAARDPRRSSVCRSRSWRPTSTRCPARARSSVPPARRAR